MEFIVNYFNELKDLPVHRSIILFGGLTFFLLLESGLPFFTKKYNKFSHLGLNLFFTFTTILVNFIMAVILIKSALWVGENNFGILEWAGLVDTTSPVLLLLGMVLGVLLMDFVGAWLPHFIQHKVVFLWQFHVIHHSDQNVDASTANRHHPGESVFRFLFTTIAVFVVGAPIWVVMIYQSLSAVLSQFNHSNMAIPVKLDNALKLVFCTPHMHRVHHHYRQPYSDTNYGNIFSFWDRIFGTYIAVDNSKLIYGVDTYMEEKEANNLGFLLKIPFSGYKQTPKHEQPEKL